MMRSKSNLIVALILLATAAIAQTQQKSDEKRSGEPVSGAAAAGDATPANDLARAAIASHGGEKFRNLKTLLLLGSVDLYAANPAQSITGKFAIAQAGERYRTDIQMPKFSIQEIFDGQRAYSSADPAGFASPSKFGISVLTHFDQQGYVTTALPEKKNQRGFRIADADGNATDFYVDPATGRIASFAFDYNGIRLSTEYKTFKEIEGVLIPYAFLQKYSARRGDLFYDFKVKESKVNQPMGDDVFIIPSR